MIVGINITHPSFKSRETALSVAGVVVSINKKYHQWSASVHCQKSQKKMVFKLENMIVKRLRVWQKTQCSSIASEYLDVLKQGIKRSISNLKFAENMHHKDHSQKITKNTSAQKKASTLKQVSRSDF
jgi:hypothetical protein